MEHLTQRAREGHNLRPKICTRGRRTYAKESRRHLRDTWDSIKQCYFRRQPIRLPRLRNIPSPVFRVPRFLLGQFGVLPPSRASFRGAQCSNPRQTAPEKPWRKSGLLFGQFGVLPSARTPFSSVQCSNPRQTPPEKPRRKGQAPVCPAPTILVPAHHRRVLGPNSAGWGERDPGTFAPRQQTALRRNRRAERVRRSAPVSRYPSQSHPTPLDYLIPIRVLQPPARLANGKLLAFLEHSECPGALRKPPASFVSTPPTGIVPAGHATFVFVRESAWQFAQSFFPAELDPTALPQYDPTLWVHQQARTAFRLKLSLRNPSPVCAVVWGVLLQLAIPHDAG